MLFHTHTHRDHSDTVDALQHELDQLQAERKELKDKLNALNKKTLFDNIISQKAAISNAARGGHGEQQQFSAGNETPSHRDSSHGHSAALSLDSSPLVEEVCERVAIRSKIDYRFDTKTKCLFSCE